MYKCQIVAICCAAPSSTRTANVAKDPQIVGQEQHELADAEARFGSAEHQTFVALNPAPAGLDTTRLNHHLQLHTDSRFIKSMCRCPSPKWQTTAAFITTTILHFDSRRN